MLGFLIGSAITGAMLLIFASPLIVAILFATKRLRYREWLAGAAFIVSLLLFRLCGDYFYNLSHWTQSRPPGWEAIVNLISLCGGPVVLAIVVLFFTKRKWRWAATIVFLSIGIGMDVHNTYRARIKRDHDAYQRSQIPVQSELVRAWDEHQQFRHAFYLQGLVQEGKPVSLLSNPFAADFKAVACSATTAGYIPWKRDPGAKGNVTELKPVKACDDSVVYSLALLKPNARYKTLTLQGVNSKIIDQVRASFSDPILRLNLFALNNRGHIAVVTKNPPDHGEDAMGPDWTETLFRIDASSATVVQLDHLN